jgi:hypothetical protein
VTRHPWRRRRSPPSRCPIPARRAAVVAARHDPIVACGGHLAHHKIRRKSALARGRRLDSAGDRDVGPLGTRGGDASQGVGAHPDLSRRAGLLEEPPLTRPGPIRHARSRTGPRRAAPAACSTGL